MKRRVTVEIDLKALVRNYRKIAAHVKPARVLCVLKANAYGLGVADYARTLAGAGCTMFGVAEPYEALELLKVRERWNDVAFVSSSAYAIDQDTEEFSLSFMLAMIKLGQPARAIDHYDTYKQMLWNVYGLTPGKEMEDLYRQAEEASNIPALSSDEIVQLILHEDEYERKAMLCSFTVFRRVTSLETRICQRDGIASSIAILSTGVADKLPPTTDIKRLERVLRDGLRASDSFARLNAATYVVLLSGANEENGMRVMERLDRQLHKLYPRSLMRMQYQVIQLTAQLPPAGVSKAE